MGFFGLLFLIFLIWFVIVPLLKIVGMVNKARRTFRNATGAYNRTPYEASPQERKGGWSTPAPRRKRINADIGEYVKFQELELTAEEIKQRADGSTTYTRTTYSETRIEDAEWEDITTTK